MLYLTQEGGVLGPLASLFGWVMNLIFEGLTKIGFVNVGVAIIIFTILTRIILYPFTAKQQKQSRMMAYIQPEIQAIQDKYRDKKDKDSVMAMNAETRAVYEKYGTSMTGSCVQLAIQMPIIFALYRVIMKIPAYVSSIKLHYETIINAFGATTEETLKKVAVVIAQFAQTNKALANLLSRSGNLGLVIEKGVVKDFKPNVTVAQIKNYIIDFLYNLNPEQMNQVANNFQGATTNPNYINSVQFIEKSNYFLGMNLPTTPWDGFNMFQGNWIYLSIPILAGLTQYISAMLMTQKKKQNPLKEESDMEKTMKSMNIMMPLMSVFFCFTFATGIGIYWITTSLLMVIQQLVINYQLDKVPVEEMIKQNIRKANEKRKKKGLKPLNEDVTVKQYVKTEHKIDKEQKEREDKIKAQVEKTKNAESFYFENENKDSLFSKVNMVKKYNDKNQK